MTPHCPNCQGGYAGRPRRFSALVRLTFIEEVPCRTGDSLKYKCGVCRGNFYFPKFNEVQRLPDLPAQRRLNVKTHLQRAGAVIG